MKNFKRCRTKFGMAEKLAAVILGAMLALGFFGCKQNVQSGGGDTPTIYLKTGLEINSILESFGTEWELPSLTKFARSDTNNDEATQYLDTEEKYITVWSEGSEVYYYVPDGYKVVMNSVSSKMFAYCSELASIDISGFDTSSVTDMSYMFAYCSKLASIDVSGFDTSSVTDMSYMFDSCSELTSIDVSGFDTSSVTDMSYIFDSCSKLASIDVSGFATSSVTDMRGMFSHCSSLESLDVTGFNTGNVTNMANMFSFCSKLASIDVSSFDTSSVTDMWGMFSNCSGLSNLDLTNFDTSNVTNMSSMFSNCSGLSNLDLTNFDTSNVTNMWGMFQESSELTTIYATEKFVTTSLADDINSINYCFSECTKLVGGAGTTFAEVGLTSAVYARIDGGVGNKGYFTVKPIGTKAPTEAKEVGDIVFSDGSATPYAEDLTLTEDQKNAAIAIIFYKGTDLNSGSDATSRTLGVGLKHGSKLAWCTSSASAHNQNITTIQCPASGDEGAYTFTGDKNGSDNLKQIGSFLSSNSSTDDTGTAANYPAFYFAENYSSTAENLGESYKDGWYLPSIAELFQIYKNKATVDAASALCGGEQFGSRGYWSSSQYASKVKNACKLYFLSGFLDDNGKNDSYSCVCAVRAFN